MDKREDWETHLMRVQKGVGKRARGCLKFSNFLSLNRAASTLTPAYSTSPSLGSELNLHAEEQQHSITLSSYSLQLGQGLKERVLRARGEALG